MNTPNRRTVISGGAAAAATVTLPNVARAESRAWRMVTSWPKNLPGPGVTAQRLADRIGQVTGGQIKVELYAAGELVSGLEVLDAVSNGTAQLGHTASFFWTGKMRAAAFFTTVPFGLTPLEHIAWIEHGGGQALWDELYTPFGVKPFMAGNSGMQMGGWLKRKVSSLEDLKGLKFRIPGLGGQMMARLGVVPVLLAPSQILPNLQSGTIDGTEFLGRGATAPRVFTKSRPITTGRASTSPTAPANALSGPRPGTDLRTSSRPRSRRRAGRRTSTRSPRPNGRTRRRSKT